MYTVINANSGDDDSLRRRKRKLRSASVPAWVESEVKSRDTRGDVEAPA